jgi:hypothetical protein
MQAAGVAAVTIEVQMLAVLVAQAAAAQQALGLVQQAA